MAIFGDLSRRAMHSIRRDGNVAYLSLCPRCTQHSSVQTKDVPHVPRKLITVLRRSKGDLVTQHTV